MEKSFEVVKTGNDKGKFKLEVNKVIKCEASQATDDLLKEIAAVGSFTWTPFRLVIQLMNQNIPFIVEANLLLFLAPSFLASIISFSQELCFTTLNVREGRAVEIGVISPDLHLVRSSHILFSISRLASGFCCVVMVVMAWELLL